MRIRALFGAAAVISFAAVATGCGNAPSVPVSDPSAGPPGSSAVAALPHDGAPKVAEPLPPSALSVDPCRVGLTGDQVTTVLGSGQIQRDADAASQLGASCVWSNLETGGNTAVAYDTKSRTGLSGVYQNTKPQTVVWRVLSPVQGFPAVAHVSAGIAPEKFCQVSVGVTDEETVDVSVLLSSAKAGKKDPCQVTEQVAGMVLANLKHQAGS
ncbi:DUF3558 domain-containing protein [Amycolatopsis sp. NPDC054798]